MHIVPFASDPADAGLVATSPQTRAAAAANTRTLREKCMTNLLMGADQGRREAPMIGVPFHCREPACLDRGPKVLGRCKTPAMFRPYPDVTQSRPRSGPLSLTCPLHADASEAASERRASDSPRHTIVT